MKPIFRSFLLSILAVCLLLPSRLLAAAPPTPGDHDRWYVMQMQGQRAGWLHETQKQTGDTIRTVTDLTLSIKRGTAAMDIVITSEFVETVDGKPISMKATTKMGAMPNTVEYKFTDAGVEVTTNQGQEKKTETKPLPEGVWLTPAAAAVFIEKRIAAGAQEIVVRSIDPSSGLAPSVATHKIKEHTVAKALGKEVPAIKWTAVTDRYPGIESIEFIDERGVLIQSDTDLGGIKVTMLLADKDLAMAKLDPPELLVKTLVSPTGRIDHPRSKRSASFVVTSTNGRLADLPESSDQTVERLSDTAIRVTVDLARNRPAPEADIKNAEYTKPSQMIGSDDEEIVKLTRLTARNEATVQTPKGQAEALRRFVYHYIETKSLDVGFASASEVVRTKTGDCSEHAVLLAAMLRADGIPSRVASGLIYADEFVGQKAIFGYHMWAQALLEIDGKKRWVDLDGTLPNDHPFDATHILLTASSLSDDETENTLVRLAPLLGTIGIKIEMSK